MPPPEKRPTTRSTDDLDDDEKDEKHLHKVSINPIQICHSAEALAFGKAIVLKKSWIVTIWGFQTGPATFNTTENFILKTPLAAIPVNCLPLYMSPAEYTMLSKGASAEKCFVKVTGKGFHTPFETGSSTANGANADTLVFGVSAKNLNHMNNLQLHKYEATAAAPTVISSSEFTVIKWDNFFYAKKSAASACLPWIHKRLTHYATVYLGKKDKDDNYGISTFIYDVNQFDLRSAQGNPIINYKHEFDIAPLKEKFTLILPEKNTVYTGMHNAAFQKWENEGDNDIK